MNETDFIQALKQTIDDGLVEVHEEENGELTCSLTAKGHEQGQRLLKKYGKNRVTVGGLIHFDDFE